MRLPLPLAGGALDGGRDPGEPEVLPDVAGAIAFAALGRLRLQATAFAFDAVFDHLAPHFPDAAAHHILKRQAHGVLDGEFLRTRGGILGFGRRLSPGLADRFQCPIDTLHLSQGLRAVVAIRVPAR